MPKENLDIEDLSQMLRLAGSEGQRSRPGYEPAPDDLSIPFEIDPTPLDEPDPTALLVDILTKQERVIYRFEQGRYLRYRVGVLGVGEAVEVVHARLKELLDQAADPLVDHLNLWVRYRVALFGGKPRGPGVKREDAELLADRLTLFKPNLLVLVNAGNVKNKFADKTPQQFALLTHHINTGAMSGGQRPYSMVLVTDHPLTPDRFGLYQRLCRVTMNTFPAERQFAPEEIGALVAFARDNLRVYTEKHLRIQNRPE